MSANAVRATQAIVPSRFTACDACGTAYEDWPSGGRVKAIGLEIHKQGFVLCPQCGASLHQQLGQIF